MLRNRQSEKASEPKISTNSRVNPNPNWRIRIKQSQLVSQASTVLLQRHSKFWAPLLKPLKLTSIFTPSLFCQILHRIQNHPKICFDFFNWAQKNLDFKPDFGVRCEVIRILFGSELSNLGHPLLNSIVQDHPPAKIVSLLQPRRSADSQSISPILNSVIECYCNKQLYLRSLEFYQMAKQYRVRLSVDTCNSLLNLLADKNEPRLAWCFYASILRNGILGNNFTWSVIAKILHKDRKFERVSRILDMGVYTPEIFDIMIAGYSKRGDFDAAFDYLNELCSKGIEPSFSTYSAMLDGACRYQNRELTESIVSNMVEKRYIMNPRAYDLIIKGLCDMGRTYAMDLFFKRASEDNIELKHATYECMLRALLCEEGRLKDAFKLYLIMQEKNILVSEGCCNEFVIALCKEDPSQEISNLLLDIIRRGFVSRVEDLSKYVSKLCADDEWSEAEELLDSIQNQGWLLDSLCCGSFMRHYCFGRQIDKAINLHTKLEELKGVLDTCAYDILLTALLKEKRFDETMKVFDYMKACRIVKSESFQLMIRGLCHEKELRKAMKLHDEMLELGLKPDKTTYKRLISGFI